MTLPAMALALAVAAGEPPQPELARWHAATAVRPAALGGFAAQPLAPGRPLARLPAAPEAPAIRSRGDAPVSAEEQARRDAVVEALLAAEAQATESPESAEEPLRAALRDFADLAPIVAEDAQAQEARAFAQLALARTLLVLERPQEAKDAIDDALRTLRGRTLPVAQFGPALTSLHDDRADHLAVQPPAELAVRCATACRVWVDEQPFDVERRELAPGRHRVWVEARAPGKTVLRLELDLPPGELVELRYELERAPAAEPRPAPVAPPAPRRILPRWATVLGVALGSSAAATGGVLWAVDHRCPDLSDPRQVPCPRILDTDAGGISLLAVGGAVAITAAVLLAVDEVRARRARANR
jgi:hypothetical protein